jgi:Xaa-Pro aminopeptidase
MQEEGVPTIEEYLAQHIKPGEVLGFDGRLLGAAKGQKLSDTVEAAGGVINCFLDPSEGIWRMVADRDLGNNWDLGDNRDKVPDRDMRFVCSNRPDFPLHPIFILSDEMTGESTRHKLARCRTYLKDQKADGIFLSKLDELMWLFNIRGSDIDCNPVALSYGYVTREEAFIFLQKDAVTEDARAYFAQNQVKLMEYEQIQTFLRELPAHSKILVDEDSCNFAAYQLLGARRVMQTSPIALWKAVKNPVEIGNMERIYLQDSVAVTKFIYWLKKKMHAVMKQEDATRYGMSSKLQEHTEIEQILVADIQDVTETERATGAKLQGFTEREGITVTECVAAAYLDNLRRSIPGFLDLSFPTISAYRSNAAMIHYETSEEHDTHLSSDGFLLVDSGGQYLGGTTDVTRTIALGHLTGEEICHYTLTAAGMLSLTAARWLKGCTGRNLDIIARTPLWNHGLDYRHGTGHGIGYILNVHEGPQSLRWRYLPESPEAILEEGMVISNEPGVYIEGSHGIRIENILLLSHAQQTDYGQFLQFQTLTWVPLDPDAIDTQYFTEEQLVLYNNYQKTVYEKISTYLTPEEEAWLREETRQL